MSIALVNVAETVQLGPGSLHGAEETVAACAFSSALNGAFTLARNVVEAAGRWTMRHDDIDSGGDVGIAEVILCARVAKRPLTTLWLVRRCEDGEAGACKR